MIIELGRLTSEVEVKEVPQNDTKHLVLNNAIAINQGADQTTFIDIVAWDKTAEFIGKHFKKGDQIFIEGEIKCRKRPVGDTTASVHFIRVLNTKRVFTTDGTEVVKTL